MKEVDLSNDCSAHLQQECAKARIYKHADQFTAGIPDRTITWNGATSWLEFKHLDASEPLHAKLGGTRGLKETQLIELIKLEKNCGRAWLIVYRKASRRTEAPSTTIYRPMCLIQPGGVKVVPTPERRELMSAARLWEVGALEFRGYRHDVVAELIHQTHQ